MSNRLLPVLALMPTATANARQSDARARQSNARKTHALSPDEGVAGSPEADRDEEQRP